jgi:hypothetical protein
MHDRLERHLDILSKYPPMPFAYDPDKKVFEVGDDFIPLSQYSSYMSQPGEPMSQEQTRELISTSKLALGLFGNHLQMPSMYSWLKSLNIADFNQVQETVTDVMIEAYKDLNERVPEKLVKGSHWGFGMGLIRPGHPTLNVLGDCACYGVEVHGHIFGEYDWEDGFAEYGLHNIDWPSQKVALFAGAGALAQMCVREVEA